MAARVLERLLVAAFGGIHARHPGAWEHSPVKVYNR
jgi:hypothetical protein